MPEYKSPQSEHGNEQRFVLVFLLMAAVIFGAQLYMKKYAPAAPGTAHPTQPTQTAPPSQPPAVNQSTAAAAPAPKRAHGSSAPVPSTQQAQSESETVVENDLYRITFTNRGGQAKSWILKKYSDDQGRPLDIVNQPAAAKYSFERQCADCYLEIQLTGFQTQRMPASRENREIELHLAPKTLL